MRFSPVRRMVVSLAVGAVPLAGCGSDTAPVATAPPTTVTPSTAAASTTPPADTVPAETVPAETVPAETAPAETPAPVETTVVQGPQVIEVDADSATPQTVTVPLGQQLSIRLTSSTSDEWHLHGYDVELTGAEVTFEFTATQAGEFTLEGHDSGAAVLTLIVEG